MRPNPLIGRRIASIGTIAATVALIILSRWLISAGVPGTTAFILVYPTALLATLRIGWLAGSATAAIMILAGWYFDFPPAQSLALEQPADVATIIAVILSCALTIAVAEIFRNRVRRAAEMRERELAERDLFFDEFDHRVTNNFALVASMIEMQRRRAGDGEAATALAAAHTRVESIARAQRHLYRGQSRKPGVSGTTHMRPYLSELCATLSEALSMRDTITLNCEAAEASLPHERAVSIGLIVNELVTNALKHAFVDREGGTIDVRFAPSATGWLLTVADDGIGMSATPITRKDGGLGTRLIEAVVRQANGQIILTEAAVGTVIRIELAP